MIEPLEFRWADPGDAVEQVAYPEGVTAVEVLGDLVTVRWLDSDGSVVWTGKLEDPGSTS